MSMMIRRMDNISFPSYTYFTGRGTNVQQLGALKLLDAKNNAAIGLGAGERVDNGTNNVFVGTQAGSNAVADSSVFVGTLAGSEASSIRGSCFLGYRAGQHANYINQSVCIGPYSGQSMIRAVDNVLLGYQAGANVVSGSRNVGIGSFAAFKQYNASDNVVIGHNAGYQNQLGSNNCFVGSSSGFSAYDCVENVCLGVSSGEGLYSGVKNVLLGYRAGANIRDASNCIAIGTSAMEFFWDGDTNTCLGTEVARQFTGTNNTILGGYSTSNGSGSYNTIIGSRSMNRQTLEQVNLSNCVIVGENIQFDIPVRPVTVGIEGFDTVPDAQLGAPDDGVVRFQDAQESFNTTTAFLLINVVPVGDPVLIKERYFAIGTEDAPMQLDTREEGSYTFRWGSGVTETNDLLATVPVELSVEVEASGVRSSLFVYGVEEYSWTFDASDTLSLFTEQGFDPPFVRVVLDGDDVVLTPDLPGTSYGCDALSVKKDAGLELGLRSPPAEGTFIPGTEVQIIGSANPSLNKVWNVVSSVDSTVTIDAPLSGGNIGNEAVLITSKVLSSSTAQVTAVDGSLRITEPSFASMVSGRVTRTVYIDGTGDIPEGVYVATVVDDTTFDIAAPLDTVDTGTIFLGSFEPLIVGLDVAATGPSKSIEGFSVTYNQRADSEIERTVFTGPFPFDGHRHAGAGTEDEMNELIRSNIITFSDEGYSYARYDIGSLNTSLSVSCEFLLQDEINFGVTWLDSYELTCRTEDTWFRVDLDYSLGDVRKTYASISNESVLVEGDFRAYTSERASVSDPFVETPSKVPLSIGSPGFTDRVKIRVDHDLKTKSLFMEVSIITDLKILDLFMVFEQVPSVNRFARTLQFFSEGGTQLSNITYENNSFTLYPTFKDCIFLGSNFTVGGNEEAQLERSNVCIASIGTQRLFRGRLDDFRVYSNLVTMNTATLTGYANTAEPTLRISPTTTNQSLQVIGHSNLDTVDIGEQLYVEGNVVCDGYVSIGEDVAVMGNGNVAQDLVVMGNVEVKKDAVFEGGVQVFLGLDVYDTLSVTADATFQSGVLVEGLFTGNGDAIVVGDVYVNSDTQIYGGLTVAQSTSLGGLLDVSGEAHVVGQVYTESWIFADGGISTGVDVYIQDVSVADYLENLDQRVNLNADDIGVLQGDVTQLEGRMDAAENRLDDIIDTDGINGYIPAIWDDLDTLYNADDAIRSDIATNEENIGYNTGDINFLYDTTIPGIEGDIQQVQTDVNGKVSKSGDTMDGDLSAARLFTRDGETASEGGGNQVAIVTLGGRIARSLDTFARSGSTIGSLSITTELNVSGRILYSAQGSSGGVPLVLSSGNRIATDTSSARYKKEIVSMPAAYLEYFNKLRPTLFKYKENDSAVEPKQAGFIAEEVDDVGFVEGVVYRGGQPEALRLPALVSLSVAAVQSLAARVDVLERQVTRLLEFHEGGAAL